MHEGKGQQNRAVDRGLRRGLLEVLCRRLMFCLFGRKRVTRCDRPLTAGETAAEVPLSPAELNRLVRTAARSVAPKELLWREGDNELLLFTAQVQATVAPGFVILHLPTFCDQVGAATVRVGFAVGDTERPAGLVAVTETLPRGPAIIVDAWGEALTAFAWQLLLDSVVSVAAEVGADVDGDRLVPAALSASKQGVSILPMAAHGITKRLSGAGRNG